MNETDRGALGETEVLVVDAAGEHPMVPGENIAEGGRGRLKARTTFRVAQLS